jgi:hypothetical protein
MAGLIPAMYVLKHRSSKDPRERLARKICKKDCKKDLDGRNKSSRDFSV